MSNRNPDSNYDQLYQSIDFFLRQRFKDLHTAIPGTIVSYDSITKRAIVQPALDMLDTSGNRVTRAALADVPVLHPSGGGYVVHLPLVANDAVMILFSERGISHFKQTYQVEAPEFSVVMSETDGVAIPGFGALTITPAGPGLVAQTEDGGTYIQIDGTKIKIKCATFEVEAGTVTIDTSSTVAINSGSTTTVDAGGAVRVDSGGNITLDSSGETLVIR